MISIEVLLAGLTGVSLCMADICGIVTDTGTTPIAGVVVQLEKGGQTATTDANGQFTIVIDHTSLLPGNSMSLQNGLSARISGNMLTVTTIERTALEVATFDLNGKSVSTMRRTLDAGSHNVVLPQRGAGVYLYKVKTGNKEFVIKGNAVGGISYASPATTQGTSITGLAKQAKAMASISDVIAATKATLLNYRCVIGSSDTSGIVIKMIANAGDVTDADGNVYQTVRIGNQVWMTENLRVTKYNDGATAIPKDTSAATWANSATPKYCYYNNTTNAESIKKYGALYNWHVVNPLNPKKIAPTGWHVPSDAEWDTLQNNLTAKGYNWDGTTTGNKIAKSLAAKTDWLAYSTTGTIGCDLTKNNRSGFSARPGGFRNVDGTFNDRSNDATWWWSATEFDSSAANHWFLNSDYQILLRSDYNWMDGRDYSYPIKSCGFSVRLVRD